MSSSIDYGYELESTLHSPASLSKSESYRPISYSPSSIQKSNGPLTYRGEQTFEPSKVTEGRSKIGQDRQNRLLNVYQSLSWIFGFKEKFSLILFFVCGGALLGFCLARAYMMNGKIMREQTVPGEFRWFNLKTYRINYIIHIYLSIVGGILVGLQFLPTIRRKSVLWHRINGYTCIILLIIGNVSGGIISRRAFGGEINAQSAYYILAIMLIFSALMGYRNVKRNTRNHRKWMLRSVVYFSVVITARLIMLASRLIISNIGTYYSLWRCDEVFFVLKNEDTLVQRFAQCASSTPSDNGLYVPVHASVHEGKLGTASAVRVVQGMALWVATIIHMALVEVYIRSTESANHQRHGFVLEARDFDSSKTYFSFSRTASLETVRELGLPIDEKKDEDSRNETNIDRNTVGTAGENLDNFPDGGLRAWSMVLGTFLSAFATFGFVNSWGVFQSYYEQTILKDSSPSDIAWIGSVQYALIFLPGLITGRMFDIGIFKIPFAVASLVLVATSMLTGQCTEYWQFILCQGVALGLACGTLFGPSMGIIGHWFKKKRGLALGINACGSSLGGTLIPIATRRLLVEVGFPWTMRILGFLMLFVLAFPNLLLARRLPPKRISGGMLNWAAFKSAPYSAYCASSLVAFLGLYTVLTYIDISASAAGIDEDFSFYLVSIANAASGFGRLSSGIACDKIGGINFMAPMTLVAAALTYAWPFATTKADFVVVAIIYGFASGVYVSCFLMPIYEMSDVHDIGRRTGMIMSIGAIGALLGPPISGAINTNTGGYTAVGYYAGSMIVVASALMILTRQLFLKKLWGKF